MSEIIRTNHSQLTDEVNVVISPDDYIDEYTNQIKTQSKSANISGFRKGMVPFSYVEKTHGKYFLSDIVLKKAEKEMIDFTKKENIQYLFQPILSESDLNKEDISKSKTYNFTFLLGLVPDLDINVVKKYLPKKYVVQVTDKEVDDEIYNLRVRYAGNDPADSVPQQGDFILNVNVFDVKQNSDEEPMFKEGIVRNEFLEETFLTNLVAKTKGESFEINLSHDIKKDKYDYSTAMLGFKKDDQQVIPKKLRLEIISIHKIILADLNEEFFAKNYHDKSVKNEQELRENVKNKIEKNYSQSSFNLWASELVDTMRSSLKIKYPDYFLERWIAVNKKPETESKEKIDEKNFKKNQGEELKKFKHDLFNSVLILNVLRQEKVEVTEEDIDKELTMTIENYFGMSGEYVQSYKENLKKNREYMTNLYHTLLDNKCLSHLQQKFSSKESTVTPKEFENVVKKHNKKNDKANK